MVHGDQQRMLVFGQDESAGRGSAGRLEIEGGAGLHRGQTSSSALRIAVLAQIMFDEQEAAVLCSSDPLHRFSVDEDESGAQRLMTRQNAVQRSTKRSPDPDRPSDAEPTGMW